MTLPLPRPRPQRPHRPQGPPALLALTLALALASASLSGVAAPAPGPATSPVADPPAQACPLAAEGVDIQVSAATPADLVSVCEGAAAAATFLRAAGLPPRAPVRLAVIAALPPVLSPTAAGGYLPGHGQGVVLTYAEFRKRRQWFGAPIDRSLYRSLAAHEAAHVITARHFVRAAPPVHATEYIAYVTMFATMPATLRTRALRAVPGRGFANADEITAVRYLFDPMGFGVAAWRHYQGLPDGPAFLRQVVAGEVVGD